MISFEGQVVAITGAGNGIGLATARLMAAHGARLVLTDIDKARLDEVAAELDASGQRVFVHALDVAASHDCDRVLERAAHHFGGIDHLVHCAGIYPEQLVKDTSDEAWKKLMGVNLDGTFYMCRAAQRHLRQNGSIVLLTSLAAQRGSYAHAAYSASKGAVQSFTRSLALELAPQIRVNAVAPGIIATSMTHDLIGQKGAQLLESTPLRRFGTAEEIAGAIAFLCSPLAGFVTGEVMQVNGGIYIA
ncbi:SDR family NAD(P)-dependent oxidoreductase [Achromobacter xylosoxidans]|uniref:SDR family NAD(P)-dependent oxidoreductase n=1 Tax=Alcaligenes xylosoxydans xylosoxydans TaxID=85698 RepID=UPI00033211C8|nr:SDR family NAD(P)-dependent oxidoreductase [Achromobacter xylosoxidans]CCH06675.1 3-oxoacyl-[acyl-carrier protein] reductase [Achromobacter xylosoxidans NH44784-1996]